ncbi:variable surface protein [Plasmodium gonderi]|uniref:Variable surface protein n=1 Tax=Plasmodium gonderi TaxID=77519 RepID=A0A1Y1JRB6_PLAGO|nr:variable surface protein [Plasmodium gonderi]GAW84018.1 variable surface protein [Plasmodium gonderi]
MIPSSVIDDVRSNLLTHVDYNMLFPRIWDDYSRSVKIHHLKVHGLSELAFACEQFGKDVAKPTSRPSNFIFPCTNLGLYLNYIKHKTYEDRRRSCKYFSYMLKREIMDKNPKCIGLNVCYNKMIDIFKQIKYRRMDLNVCRDQVEELKNDSYYILYNLDELYKKFYKLKEYNNENHYTWAGSYVPSCEKYYKIILEKYEENKNSSLKTLLDKYKKEFDENMTKLNAYKSAYKSRHEYPTTNKSIKTRTDRSIGAKTDVGINTGMGSFMTFFVFIIIVIIFIFYKYTNYGSYLHPSVKKIRKMMNKKNKENINIKDSFERRQKNSFGNIYHVVYTSVDH